MSSDLFLKIPPSLSISPPAAGFLNVLNSFLNVSAHFEFHFFFGLRPKKILHEIRGEFSIRPDEIDILVRVRTTSRKLVVTLLLFFVTFICYFFGSPKFSALWAISENSTHIIVFNTYQKIGRLRRPTFV